MNRDGSSVSGAGRLDLPDGFFRRLVESVTAVTYVLSLEDPEGAPLYVSPRCEAVLGLPLEAMKADAPARNALLHPDDRERIRDRAAEAIRSSGEWDEEYRLTLPDGSARWVRDRAHIVPDPDGGPGMWFGVLTELGRGRDIERALGGSEARYQALVEQLPAIVYIDSHERSPVTLYTSPQTERITGYRSEEYLADPQLWLRMVHPDDRGGAMQPNWPLVESGDERTVTYRVFHRDGHVIWLQDTYRLLRADDGSPLFWQGVVVDVTPEKRVEQDLRDAEAKYRTLVEQLPAVVFIDTNEEAPSCVYVSPQSTEMLGRPPEAFVGDPTLWMRTIHPEDRERVGALWVASIRTQQPFVDEFRFVRPDGEVRWLYMGAVPIKNADGETVAWQGLIQDVTEHKAIELELRASEARYRALVEKVPAVVYDMGPDDVRRTLYVSPHVEALFGYTRQEWLDQPDIWVELLHPDDREIVLAAHDRHNETGEPWSQEYRLIANDGRTVWVRDQAALVRDEEGLPPTWHGVLLDVTAQKDLEEQLRISNEELERRVQARTAELAEANEMMSLEIGERRRVEVELRQARERYRRLVEDVPAVVYTWSFGRGGESELYTSPFVEELLGYTPEEWNDDVLWLERVHPHDRPRILEAVERCEETGESFSQEYRFLAKDGHVVWVLDHATLLSRDDRGRPLLYQGLLIDISQRRAAEDAAEDARERLEAVEALGPIAFYDFEVEHGPESRVAFHHLTPSLARLTATSPEDLARDPRSWLRSVHPDDREHVSAGVEHQLETGEPAERSYRVIDTGGDITWVRSITRCVARDDSGRPRRFQGVIIDVTNEKAEQKHLRRSTASLREFIETIPGIPWMRVVESGPGSGRTVYVGPQAERILGYTEDELLAEPDHFRRMLHPSDRERILEHSRKHDRTGDPWSEEYRMIARDGRVVWFRSEGIASRSDDGMLAWHGIAFDVTALKEDQTIELPDVAPAEPER